MKGFLSIPLNNKQWFLVYAVCIFLLLIVYLVVIDIKIGQYLYNIKVIPFPLKTSLAQYPILTTKDNPNISAPAAVVMDDESKVLLFSKNVNFSLPMASTTKIMTALVGLSYYKMDDVLTINVNNVEGAKIGLERGQRVRFEDLLYAMLLPSANDAALAIAQNYPGGETEFIKKMNNYAGSLHLYNTHFADAIGLLDDRDYTTPLDLARLTSIALKNKIFATVVSTKHKVITDVSGKNSYVLNNLNKLLDVDGVKGVKTGYTDRAGQVLVTSKDEGGHTIITVVMASVDRFLDTQKLLNLISGNVTYLSIHP